MALDVFHACDTDSLIDELVAHTESGRQSLAAWRTPVTVIVPSPEMGSYVELAISRRLGVAINYEFVTLQGFLTTLVEQAAQDRFRVLGREILKTVLLHHFGDPGFFADDRFPAIERYLNLAGKKAGRARDTRRYQLARQLATVFEEYIFSRADMLAAWRAGKATLGASSPAVADIEAWQAELWRHITDDDGCVRFDGQTFLPLPSAFERVRGELAANLQDASIHKLYVFGFAGFGEEFLTMLESLGDSDAHNALDLSIYFKSPTAEASPSGEADEDETHPALRNWAKVGQDTFAQLQGAASHVASVRAQAERAPTVLGQLQEQIIAGKKVAPPDIDDDSIRLLECPGVRREVEIVANEIWSLMGKDDGLRFSDIAVAVPDGEKDRYLAHIQSVFGEFHRLPYTINSLSLDGQSPVLEAAEQLLRLPFGRFRRGELLSLAVHPNIAGQQGEDDEERWIDWTERLNILYGADRADQSTRGTYLSGDLFNWEQGLRRLALGSFLSVPDARDEATVALEDHQYLPQQVDLSEVDTASAFTAVIGSLTSDARWLAEHKATLADWSEILCALVETYVVPSAHDDGDYATDLKDRARVLQALEALEELPNIGDVSYRTVSLYALDLLSGLDTGGTHRFVGGVVISSPARLRSLPFEHLFVLGMGEGVFPSLDPQSELDLRLVDPRPGDILPSERDKYHFLELLESTRKNLRLSWVGRESTTGESVPASSIINDLRRMLGVRRPEKETACDSLTTVYPLRRYDRHGNQFSELGIEKDARPANEGVSEQLGVNYHPEAFREAQLDAVREKLEQIDGVSTKTWTSAAFFDANRRFFGAQAADKLAADKQDADKQDADLENQSTETRKPVNIARIIPPPNTTADGQERVFPSRLRYSKLYQFLKTPLQTKAKVFAGIYDEKADSFAVEHEPFAYENLQQVMLTRDVFSKVLTDDEPEPDMVGELNAVAVQNYEPGDLPADVFQECANRSLSPKLDDIYENLTGAFANDCGLSIDEPVQLLELTPSATGEQIEAPTIRLQLADNTEVELKLVGTTLPYFPESQRILQVIKKKYAKPKDFLRGYIEHLVLSASPSMPEKTPRTVVVAPANSWSKKTSFPKFRLELDGVGRKEAREQLEKLAHDLLVAPNFRLFPVELVEAIVNDGELSSDPAQLHRRAWQLAIEKDGGYRSDVSTQYGPIADYLNYPPPDDPMAVIARRFRYHPKFDPELEGEA